MSELRKDQLNIAVNVMTALDAASACDKAPAMGQGRLFLR
jgi:hypothetical protein